MDRGLSIISRQPHSADSGPSGARTFVTRSIMLRQVENNHKYGVIQIDGKEYAVTVKSNLCFIDNEEVEDPWNTLESKWRTPDGRLYSTLTPFLWILGLVMGALLLLLAGLKAKLIKWLALLVVPVMIALAHAGGKSEDEFSSAGHNATNERDARKQRETDESRARQREEDEYRRWRWEKR